MHKVTSTVWREARQPSWCRPRHVVHVVSSTSCRPPHVVAMQCGKRRQPSWCRPRHVVHVVSSTPCRGYAMWETPMAVPQMHPLNCAMWETPLAVPQMQLFNCAMWEKPVAAPQMQHNHPHVLDLFHTCTGWEDGDSRFSQPHSPKRLSHILKDTHFLSIRIVGNHKGDGACVGTFMSIQIVEPTIGDGICDFVCFLKSVAILFVSLWFAN